MGSSVHGDAMAAASATLAYSYLRLSLIRLQSFCTSSRSSDGVFDDLLGELGVAADQALLVLGSRTPHGTEADEDFISDIKDVGYAIDRLVDLLHLPQDGSFESDTMEENAAAAEEAVPQVGDEENPADAAGAGDCLDQQLDIAAVTPSHPPLAANANCCRGEDEIRVRDIAAALDALSKSTGGCSPDDEGNRGCNIPSTQVVTSVSITDSTNKTYHGAQAAGGATIVPNQVHTASSTAACFSFRRCLCCFLPKKYRIQAHSPPLAAPRASTSYSFYFSSDDVKKKIPAKYPLEDSTNRSNKADGIYEQADSNSTPKCTGSPPPRVLAKLPPPPPPPPPPPSLLLTSAPQPQKPNVIQSQPSAVGDAMKDGWAIPHKHITNNEISHLIERLCHITTCLKDSTPSECNIKLCHLQNSHEMHEESFKPVPILSVRELYGRKMEKEKLITLLLDSNDEKVTVVPIIGAPGTGKTTLAHYVYSDSRIEKHFDLRLWICSSDNLDMMMVRRIDNESGTFIGHDLADIPLIDSLDLLERILKVQLEGRKFLLMLDGVKSLDWTTRCASFGFGVKGCKILITAEEENVVDDNSKRNKVALQGLEGPEFQLFFNRCVFDNDDPGEHHSLLGMAMDVAQQLKGFPLLAKMVGGVLRGNLIPGHWMKILSDISWKLDNYEEHSDIMPVLMWCYQNLPCHLQLCLAYCSVFPKGYSFSADTLVNHWIAHGLIHPNKQSRRMEDLGREYFDSLLSKRFFETPIYTKTYGPSVYYVMHDSIHDLVSSINADECYIHDQTSEKIPNSIRHLSMIRWYKGFNPKCKWGNLCTLLINSSHFLNFEELRNIRVLDLSYSHMVCLPDSVGGLVHLRYLDISGNNICCLPGAIGRLHHMKTLIIPDHCSRLPNETTKLINLRHLRASNNAITRLPEIGKLVCLQELKAFCVRLLKGHDIGQLKNMNQIHGKLCISNLNLIKNEESFHANLEAKMHIQSLQLKWTRWKGKGVNSQLEEDTLECLQPTPLLEEIEIHWYRGGKAPCWLAPQCLIRLKKIYLRGCENLKCLPSLAQFPLLEVLHMYGMDVSVDGAREMTDMFPSLTGLFLEDMSIYFHGMTGVEVGLQKFFLSLRKLVIRNCRMVKGLPQLTSFLLLENLEIKDNLNHASELPDCLSGSCLLSMPKLCVQQPPSLATLKISAKYLGLVSGEVLKHLKHLEIESVDTPRKDNENVALSVDHGISFASWSIREHMGPLSLSSLAIINGALPDGPILEYLTTLKELRLDNVFKLRSFNANQQCWFSKLRYLQYLTITNCKSLKSLPLSLDSLLSLEKLTVNDCPMMQEVPTKLPASLKSVKDLELWTSIFYGVAWSKCSRLGKKHPF